MPAIRHLLARDAVDSGDASTFEVSTGTLVLTFFALLFLATALSILLLFLRRRRLAREQGLSPAPSYTGHCRSAPMSRISTCGPNDGVFVCSPSPPLSPVPEIRVTFPDDDDQLGSQKQGRVVVVHVTDTGSVGMAPLHEEQLPPYQRVDGNGFQSLDLNRIGGGADTSSVGGHSPSASLHLASSSSHSDHGGLDGDAADSPAHIKKTVEAHLREIERQLQETQRLGTSLLEQHTEFTEKLNEVDDDQEAVPLELRKRLAQLGRDHDDVGREVARALLPRSRAVSGDDKPAAEPGVYSNQAGGAASPTKVAAPSRRQRNQPSKHAGDLQFAADISTSLLAQVRQLQAAVAERDDTIKNLQAEQGRLDQDSRALSQRVRALDENEQRYKDENWNLETQNHHLQTAARDAADREKRLNTSLAVALAANAKLQTEFDEALLAHARLQEEHAAARKAHDTEVHSLKRSVDQGDDDKIALNAKIDELTAQNQELALAINARFRAHHPPEEEAAGDQVEEESRDPSTPEHSPPPSPTKATPRHPALESETLRSSLHHAHRMIQNLKNSIHREKTEKIELKRMLQDARDELERSRDSPANATKRQRTKDSRKPARPDLLGAGHRSRTEVEFDDDDWEDASHDTPSHGRRILSVPGAYRATDVSDAYITSTETDGPFETADEKHGTESEDFQTGAESMPDDSVDDLTETEDNAIRARAAAAPGRASKPPPPPLLPLASKNAGDRLSFLSTASTSADEEDGLSTPILTPHKFRLKNGRQSLRQSRHADRGTPQSAKDLATLDRSSPASLTAQNSSPPAAEQSLYAELGGLDDASSAFGTPGQPSLASTHSTPHNVVAPNSRDTALFSPASAPKPIMVDSAMMTEPLQPGPGPAPAPDSAGVVAAGVWTPQRAINESPAPNMASFITPPKTVWDEEGSSSVQTPEAPATQLSRQQFHYSGVLTQDTLPINMPEDKTGEAESHPRTAERTAGKRPLSSIAEYNAGQTAAGMTATPNARPGDRNHGLTSLSANDDAAHTTFIPDQPDSPDASSSSPKELLPLPASPSKRPSSSSSHRSSSLLSQQHPPLPADHRNAIEKAGGMVAAAPAREAGPASQPVVGTMGPPAIPASAMRRPRTPNDQTLRSPVRDGTVSRVPNARTHQRTATQASQTSRRSSMSSFASELDERFNIRPSHQPAAHAFDPSSATDPRMIQAITQTMIGEFLWKYTRKPGRAEMSDTRHRRYFWVHPYTKTLYWSTQDPQTAGRAQLNAKSVAIASVRVITDDNPMPPGLHRKSLEVTTPSRKIKFTASTGQRHETWFNALSYLLLRNEHQAESAATPYMAGNTKITKDDVNEFNVYGNGYGAHLVPTGSRASMSSYNSRTTRGTATHADSTKQGQQLPPVARACTSMLINSQQPQKQAATATHAGDRRSRADQPRQADKDRTIRTSSVSRFSRMIGSVTKRTSRSVNRAGEGLARSEAGSIYDASVVSDTRRDSAEEMRREMLRQERDGLNRGLENVRACCDGKHDVSTLSRDHSHRVSTPTSQFHRGIGLRDTISRRTAGVN
ncbi:hypothetical protein DV737_g3657, partial [Chaetothyriales sp. CBS 132003]